MLQAKQFSKHLTKKKCVGRITTYLLDTFWNLSSNNILSTIFQSQFFSSIDLF